MTFQLTTDLIFFIPFHDFIFISSQCGLIAVDWCLRVSDSTCVTWQFSTACFLCRSFGVINTPDTIILEPLRLSGGRKCRRPTRAQSSRYLPSCLPFSCCSCSKRDISRTLIPIRARVSISWWAKGQFHLRYERAALLHSLVNRVPLR